MEKQHINTELQHIEKLAEISKKKVKFVQKKAEKGKK